MANHVNGVGLNDDEDDLPALINDENEDDKSVASEPRDYSGQTDGVGDDDENKDEVNAGDSDDNPPALVEDPQNYAEESNLPAPVGDDFSDDNGNPPPLVEDDGSDGPPDLTEQIDDSDASWSDNSVPELAESTEEDSSGSSDSDEDESEDSSGSGSDAGMEVGCHSGEETGKQDVNYSHKSSLKRGFFLNSDKGKRAVRQEGTSAECPLGIHDSASRLATKRDFPTKEPRPSPEAEGASASESGVARGAESYEEWERRRNRLKTEGRLSESYEEWERRRNRLKTEGRLSNSEKSSIQKEVTSTKGHLENDLEKALRGPSRLHDQQKAARVQSRRKKQDMEKMREAEVASTLAESKRLEEVERLMRERAVQQELLNAEIGICRSLDPTKCPNSSAVILLSQRHIEVACSDACTVRCHYPACWKVMESRKKQHAADWKLLSKASCITPDCPGEIVRALVKENGKVEYQMFVEEKKKHKDHQDVGGSRRPPHRRIERSHLKAGGAGPKVDASTPAEPKVELTNAAETLIDIEEHGRRKKYRGGPVRLQVMKEKLVPSAIQPPTSAATMAAVTSAALAASNEKDGLPAKALRAMRGSVIPKPTEAVEGEDVGSSQQVPSSLSSSLQNDDKQLQAQAPAQPQPIVNMEEVELVVYNKKEEEDVLFFGKGKVKKGKANKEKKKKVMLQREFTFQPNVDELDDYEAKLERMLAAEYEEQPVQDLPIARPISPTAPQLAPTASAEFPPLFPSRMARAGAGTPSHAWKEPVPVDPMHSYYTDRMSKHLLVINVDIELEDVEVKMAFQEYCPQEMLRFYPQGLAVLSFHTLSDATSALFVVNQSRKAIGGKTVTCRYLSKVPPWDLYQESVPSTVPTITTSNPDHATSSESYRPDAAQLAQQTETQLQMHMGDVNIFGGARFGRSLSLDTGNATLSPSRAHASSAADSDISPPIKGGLKKESRLKADVQPFVPGSLLKKMGSLTAAAVETVSAPPSASVVSSALAADVQLPPAPPVFASDTRAVDEGPDGPPPLTMCRFKFGNVIACNHHTLAMYKDLRRFSLQSDNLTNIDLIRPNNSALFMLNVEGLGLYGAYKSNCSGVDPFWTGDGPPPMRESIGFEPIEEFLNPIAREDYEQIFPNGWFEDSYEWTPQLPLSLSDMQVEALLDIFESINHPLNGYTSSPSYSCTAGSVLHSNNVTTVSTTAVPPFLPPTMIPPQTQTIIPAVPPPYGNPAPQTTLPSLAKLTLASRRDQSPSSNRSLSTTPTNVYQHSQPTFTSASTLDSAAGHRTTGLIEPDFATLLPRSRPTTPATTSRPTTPAPTASPSIGLPGFSPFREASTEVAPPVHDVKLPVSDHPTDVSRQSFELSPSVFIPKVENERSSIAETISALLDPQASVASDPPLTASSAEPAPPELALRAQISGTSQTQNPFPALLPSAAFGQPTISVLASSQLTTMSAVQSDITASAPRVQATSRPSTPVRAANLPPGFSAPSTQQQSTVSPALPVLAALATSRDPVAVNLAPESSHRPPSLPQQTDHQEIFPFLFPKAQPESSDSQRTEESARSQVSPQPPSMLASNVQSTAASAMFTPTVHTVQASSSIPSTMNATYQPRQRPRPYNPPRQPYNPMAAAGLASSAAPRPTQSASRIPSAPPVHMFQSALPSAVPVGVTTEVATRPAAAPPPTMHIASRPSDHHGQQQALHATPPPDPINNRASETPQQSTPSVYMCRYCMVRRSDYLFLSCRHFGPCLSCAETKEISSCLQCGSRDAKETWHRVFL